MDMLKLTSYEALLDRESKCYIIDTDYTGTKIPAAAVRAGGIEAVFINEKAFSTDRERKLALTHEIAHIKTDGFYTEETSKKECARIEFRANKCTVLNLVPFGFYKAAILAGCHTEWEQAEYWDIPQCFVSFVHKTYEQIKWDEIQALRASFAAV